MYSNYFGFSELPFTIAPNPRYLYLSEQHREALASLLYGINCNGGFVLLTGDVGTGKTTVCRCLLEQLPENTEVAVILNPKYSITELLEAICDELKIHRPHNSHRIKGYIDAINQHLLEAHGRGINTVLIIDEAQNLGLDVLEQIRLLTNLETSSQKLLQIILIGQPELLATLARPELRQLDQRITARYHLHALSREELPAYVGHRLAVGGRDAPLFSRAALHRLYRLTGGVPRMINVICDRALLGAYVERRPRVNWWLLNRAAREVRGQFAAPASTWRWALLPLALLLLLLGGFLIPGGRELLAWMRPVPVEQVPAPPAAPLPVPVAEPVAAPAAEPEASELPAGGQVQPALLPSSPAQWQWPAGTDLTATEVLAYQRLFDLWGLDYDPQQAPVICRFARQHGLDCLQTPGPLEELLGFNLPAVISLRNAGGQRFHATLVGLDQQTGRATLDVAGEPREVELEDLRNWLDAGALLLWRLPPGYQEPLRPETSSPVVPWLAARLAKLQGLEPPRGQRQRYDEPLQMQVLAFQHQYQLATDAVLGPQTLIRLSTLTEPGIPLLTAAAEADWE
ncbi:AAA family ATPase [Pseudomonas sp. L-22-4S-12]|uniref:ExeA family protein n=1 Tax=Pseudomonas sp. L-22-4S-12 TaxID=2610893 RepID=UPI001328ADC0|nr:AAA family ATPase [Pseudomonas sp. L-22-4S-12]MWV14685.1 AAA family ATPase [Pseudomonas sp. L-22-4S-12]